MIIGRWYLFVTALLLVGPALNIAAVASAVGASVQNVNYDANANTATIRIVNNSSKNISAYAMAVDAAHANGRTEHSEELEDFQLGRDSGNSIHPGDSREHTVWFASAKDNPVVTVNAKIVAVIYNDRSAEVDNEAAFQRMLDVRVGSAKAYKQAMESVSKALADSTNTHPRATALEGVKQLAYQAKARNDASAGELSAILHDLEAPQQAGSESEYLKGYLADLTRRAAFSSENAQIRRMP